ncbi:MAG TPA: pitrilysin family protein [Sphingobacteriaceae bacterium]
MDYQIHQLTNGIRVLHKPSSSNISHACILINAGSRDEARDKMGLAHFIEHLMFKRTEKRTTHQILNRLELVGADLNAYTTKEYTCIHASFLGQHLERSLDLFEDILFHSVFPEEEMEKEKGVVLDEIASYQDLPEEAIQDDFEDIIFAGHPLGTNILGTAETVSLFSRTDILQFLNANYCTNEIVIGITGNDDFKKVKKITEKVFGKLGSNTPARHRTPLNFYRPSMRDESRQISQTHCVIGNRAYDTHHKLKVPLLLLNNLLGGTGMSSRLNLQLREKYGIAYTIESNYTPLTDTGIFSVYFGTDTEKATRALNLIHREFRKLREVRLGEIQLHQTKQKFNGQIALAEENRLSLIISLAKSLLDYNRVDTLDEVMAKVNAVTADQLLEVANEVLDPAQLTTLLFKAED